MLSSEMYNTLSHWKRVIFRHVTGRTVSQDAWDRSARLQSNIDDMLNNPKTTDDDAHKAVEKVRQIIADGGLL